MRHTHAADLLRDQVTFAISTRPCKSSAMQKPGHAKGRIAAACIDLLPLVPRSRGRGMYERGRTPGSQRWRALKRGLLLQITKTLPRRRTTLQSR